MHTSQQRQFTARTHATHRHQRERARKAGAAVPHSLAELRALIRAALDGPGCYYCGIPLNVGNFSVDHRQPVARGGAWGMDNLAVCCSACNQAKGALTESEYESLLALVGCWESRTRDFFLRRLRAGGRVIRCG